MPEQTNVNGGFIVNIEFSVKEENGVVKIKIILPDKPVVIETDASTNATDTPVTEVTVQKETASSTKESTNPDVAADAETTALAAKLAAMNREYERVKKGSIPGGQTVGKESESVGTDHECVSNWQSRSGTGRCPLLCPPCPGSLSPDCPQCPQHCPRGHLGTGDSGYCL